MTGFFRRLFGKRPDDTPMRDVTALAAPLAAPAIQIVALEQPSLSHFGGAPELPPGVPWPERDGARLGFLSRLSLPELQRALAVDWLPKTGALLFFYDLERQPWGYDPKDRGSFAVLLVPDLPEPPPRGDAPKCAPSPMPYRSVGFRRIDVLPSPEREPVVALGLTERESDAYFELADAPFQGLPKHQVSGFPSPVQEDEMELECQLASNGVYCGDAGANQDPRAPALAPGTANWRLLLQLDTDDDLGVMWGDGGTIFYWVEEHKARSGDFSNAWLILQCT